MDITLIVSFVVLLVSLAAAFVWKRRALVPLVAGSIISILVSYLLHYPISMVIISVAIAAISAVIAIFYEGNRHFYPLSIILCLFVLCLLLHEITLIIPVAQMFAIGTMTGFVYLELTTHKKQIRSKKGVEVNRDMFQICLGIVVLAILLAFGGTFMPILLITYGIIAIYIYNRILDDFGRNTTLYKKLSSFERPKTIFGHGAMYAAAGLLLLFGFIGNYNFLAVGVFALFIADPLATVVGHSAPQPKLMYNKRKSVAGTLAFFVATALFGYMMIGIYAVPLALVLAIVESLPIRLDDNVTIPIVSIVASIIYSTL